MNILSILLKKPGIKFHSIKYILAGKNLLFSNKFININLSLINLYKDNLNKNIVHEIKLVKFLKNSEHIKGRKFIFKLPVRGQRTHTNARTSKKLILDS